MLSAYALMLSLHMPSFSSYVSALLLMYIELHPWTVTAIRCSISSSISSSLVTLQLQHCAHFLQSWQPCSSVQSVHGHFILFFPFRSCVGLFLLCIVLASLRYLLLSILFLVHLMGF